jgi:hypothetical protein
MLNTRQRKHGHEFKNNIGQGELVQHGAAGRGRSPSMEQFLSREKGCRLRQRFEIVNQEPEMCIHADSERDFDWAPRLITLSGACICARVNETLRTENSWHIPPRITERHQKSLHCTQTSNPLNLLFARV